MPRTSRALCRSRGISATTRTRPVRIVSFRSLSLLFLLLLRARVNRAITKIDESSIAAVIASTGTGRAPSGLLFSPKSYNSTVGLAIVCLITSRQKGYPFEVALPSGLSVRGAVLSDHIRSLDWRPRRAEFICRAPEEIIDEVIAKVPHCLSTKVDFTRVAKLRHIRQEQVERTRRPYGPVDSPELSLLTVEWVSELSQRVDVGLVNARLHL